MKRILDIDDNLFVRLFDNGTELSKEDKEKLETSVRNSLLITDRPAVIINRQFLYITQGHIDAMVEYEKEQARQEVFESILRSLNGATIVEPRIEYGTDRQPYKMSMTSGQVVPDNLQGWRYEKGGRQ